MRGKNDAKFKDILNENHKNCQVLECSKNRPGFTASKKPLKPVFDSTSGRTDEENNGSWPFRPSGPKDRDGERPFKCFRVF